MVRGRGVSFRWVSLSRSSPLLRESCRPQGEAVRMGPLRTAAFTSRFGRALSVRVTLTGRKGRTGRRGTFTGQCCQPLCAGGPTRHLHGPQAVTESRPAGVPSQGFVKFRRLAHRVGRIVTPPAPSSPGPFAAAGCPATLAAYPSKRVRVRISGPARTRPGRIRFHQTSTFKNRTV